MIWEALQSTTTLLQQAGLSPWSGCKGAKLLRIYIEYRDGQDARPTRIVEQWTVKLDAQQLSSRLLGQLVRLRGDRQHRSNFAEYVCV